MARLACCAAAAGLKQNVLVLSYGNRRADAASWKHCRGTKGEKKLVARAKQSLGDISDLIPRDSAYLHLIPGSHTNIDHHREPKKLQQGSFVIKNVKNLPFFYGNG